MVPDTTQERMIPQISRAGRLVWQHAKTVPALTVSHGKHLMNNLMNTVLARTKNRHTCFFWHGNAGMKNE